jgi:hypothetical protein
MPEATMNENDFFTAAENQIGVAGEILCVKTVTISLCEYETAQKHLWSRVFRANPGHNLGALGRGNIVHVLSLHFRLPRLSSTIKVHC